MFKLIRGFIDDFGNKLQIHVLMPLLPRSCYMTLSMGGTVVGSGDTVSRSCNHYITCISIEFANVQFEAGSLVAQFEVLVLGKSIATFVIPKVYPQDPLPGFVLGQGINIAKTKPMIL